MEGDPSPTAGGMARGLAQAWWATLWAPAVWAAAALLLSVPGTSGKTLRACSWRKQRA